MQAILEKIARSGVSAVTTTAAVSSASDIKAGVATLNGKLHRTELGAGLAPATKLMRHGLAFTPYGALYTTNTAPTAGDTVMHGFAIRPDGALRINTSTQTGKVVVVSGVANKLGRISFS